MKKTKKALLSLLSASAMLFNAAPIGSISAADNEKGELPNWVPANFEDALNFSNTNGATLIEQNRSGEFFVCLVNRVHDLEEGQYTIRTTDNVKEVYHEFFKSENTDAEYEVAVYSDVNYLPQGFKIEFWDMTHNEAEKTYTFFSNGGQLTETDEFAWAPDCYYEFKMFEEHNGIAAGFGDVITFCETLDPISPCRWIWGQSGTTSVKEIVRSDCSMQHEEPPTDLQINTFVLYKPESEGVVNMKWEYLMKTTPERTIDTIEKSFLVDETLYNIQELCDGLTHSQGRITLVDYETGEKIAVDKEHPVYLWADIQYIGKVAAEPYNQCRMIVDFDGTITENPFVCDLASHKNADVFKYYLDPNRLPEGYFVPNDGTEVVMLPNGALDVTYKLKKYILGDVNDDGSFGVSDVVTFQKWLIGSADIDMANWKAADFNSDGSVDVFDLCLMKKALTNEK